MRNDNNDLQDNLKALVGNLSLQMAVPLGSMSGLPFLAVKVLKEYEDLIEEGKVRCEMKPSVLNIDFGEETIALCFVQIRLNADDNLIYTVSYDLNIEKHYNDCIELLNMKKYGLLIASDTIHDFMAFDNTFEADFDPRAVAIYAKEQASDYSPELFAEASYAISSQANTRRELWDFLDEITPFDKRWYVRMTMNKE